MFFIFINIIGVFAFLEFISFSNSKLRTLLYFCVGILFFALSAFNSYSPDLENYKIHYDNYDQEFILLYIEPFIIFIMKLCHALGFEFQGFQICMAGLTFFFLLIGLHKLTPIPIFILLNFYFIPYFPDIVQIRFFLGFSIFLYSFLFLERSKFKYYLFQVFSISCHYSLIVLLLFPIFRSYIHRINNFFYNLIILSVTLLLLNFSKSGLQPLLLFIGEKQSLYLESNSQTQIGTFLLFLPFLVINNIVLYFNSKYSSVIEISLKSNFVRHIPIVVDLVKFSSLLIWFQLFIRDFSRLSYNIYILVLVYFSYIIIHFWVKQKTLSIALGLFCFFYTVLLYYIQFLMLNNFNYFNIIADTINSNYLF